jgi:hypothetical protein
MSKHKYRMEVREGGLCAASLMGYKPHQPTIDKLYPDASALKQSQSTLYTWRKGNTISLMSESNGRFDILGEPGSRRAEPAEKGGYRRFCADVASSDMNEARDVLNSIAEEFDELFEFDQQKIIPEYAIWIRIINSMVAYNTMGKDSD